MLMGCWVQRAHAAGCIDYTRGEGSKWLRVSEGVNGTELRTSLPSQLLCCHFKLASCWKPRGPRVHQGCWTAQEAVAFRPRVLSTLPELSVGKAS